MACVRSFPYSLLPHPRTYVSAIADVRSCSQLVADPDINVKNGAQLLDRLLKDIVTESNVFEIEKFIVLLRVPSVCIEQEKYPK